MGRKHNVPPPEPKSDLVGLNDYCGNGYYTAEVSSINKLNMRATPDGEVIETLQPGDVLIISCHSWGVLEQYTWFAVHSVNGVKREKVSNLRRAGGFVRKEYLTQIIERHYPPLEEGAVG